MRKFIICFFGIGVFAITACDLQPKILSLPDSVGEFISARYPALLADPDTQPEIYNSAAADYGVYASPELYGAPDNDDYVLYSDVKDYTPPADAAGAGEYGDPTSSTDAAATDNTQSDVAINDTPLAAEYASDNDYLNVPMYGGGTVTNNTEVTVAAGDTLYSLAKRYNTTVDDLAKMNNLSAPYSLSVGQKIKVGQQTKIIPPQTVTVARRDSSAAHAAVRVKLTDITVAPGDTLYSISRKYSVPVNDLAVMNKLATPFTLSVGQKLKVPDLSAPSVAAPRHDQRPASVARPASGASGRVNAATQTVPAKQPTATKPVSGKGVATTTVKKANKPAPAKKPAVISARSSSKFSWPVRGTILSHYGAKSGGLFNDGINIAATRGTAVKAAENGVVAYAGNEVKGMGNLIIIQHSGGWMTVYAHMDSMTVRRGAKVSVGSKIGTVGATGKVDRPQLHFEIRKGTKAYNPSSYLKK